MKEPEPVTGAGSNAKPLVMLLDNERRFRSAFVIICAGDDAPAEPDHDRVRATSTVLRRGNRGKRSGAPPQRSGGERW